MKIHALVFVVVLTKYIYILLWKTIEILAVNF